MQQFEPIPTVPPEGRRRAFAYRNFRIYFLGSLISVCGPWMQGTAQAWLVLQLTNSPIALATVTSLQFLPIMLLSLVGGAVADRLPRRRLMFTTQSLAACQAVLLGVLVLTNTVTIWHIYLLAITLGTINALDAPLRWPEKVILTTLKMALKECGGPWREGRGRRQAIPQFRYARPHGSLPSIAHHQTASPSRH